MGADPIEPTREARRARTASFVVAAALVAGGCAVLGPLLGPDPARILEGIEVPPAPVLSPKEEHATFRVAPGFRVELVAAEPLVVDPIALDWDDEGRLYVVEMRGYMPDIDGNGEDAPVGQVVVLEDTDLDGRMDRRTVFLDGLVMPRALVVLPEGVLVGSPPDLIFCSETDAAGRCANPIRVHDYGSEGVNPEHRENGLFPAFDGWLYNSSSDRRFRIGEDAGSASGVSVVVEKGPRRGQWGLAQDDAGRLYHNHNSGFLYVDLVPGHYLARQASTLARFEKVGMSVDLAPGEKVHGIRVAPGLNRAYLRGTLRGDGRQNGPTGVSGLTVQRGHQYGAEYVGHAFVPEAAGGVVAHFAVTEEDGGPRAEHRLYPDDIWDEREFLASTDERFRPVSAYVGPDGAVWVVDMYRGVIQHAHYVSEHLRGHIERQGLEPPGETGRIWRVVREDRAIDRSPPALDGWPAQVSALDHPNGWVRDRAQRRLTHEGDEAALARLRDLGSLGAHGRSHALRVLAARRALLPETVDAALADGDVRVRLTALRAAAAGGLEEGKVVELALGAWDDPNPVVREQAAFTLGDVRAEARPLGQLLARGRTGDARMRQAVLSSLGGVERAALDAELGDPQAEVETDAESGWLTDLAAAAQLAGVEGGNAGDLLDLAVAEKADWRAVAILEGVAAAMRFPGVGRAELARRPALFAEENAPTGARGAAAKRIRSRFTWLGDPRPGGARALTELEEGRRVRGAGLYADTCAACHGPSGRGRDGLAPRLAGSTWVRDADDWLVRIVLQGLTGPVTVAGEIFEGNMPGHGAEDHFDDEALAAVFTFLRRAWGHAEEPVTPETVARIRAATAARDRPWTEPELKALSVDHRLDRFVGIYRVPLVGMELEVSRRDSQLRLGMKGGGAAELEEAGEGRFLHPELGVEFEMDDEGRVQSATAIRDGMSFPLSRVE